MNTDLLRVRKTTGVLISMIMCSAATGALAQAAPAKSVETKAVEEVVVTGSRIRGVAPVGSNLISVGQDTLSKVPAYNAVDLLRQVPQVSGYGTNEQMKSQAGPTASGTNASRTDTINLRGIGASATLVLFDGIRVPSAGISGTQIDMTSLPVIALQRVEVVADGSSAIYGSDAVAGVVNFVPRTRGAPETRMRIGHADGYDSYQFSHIMGGDWGTGGWVLALQHTQNSNLNGTERDYYKSDLRAQGGHDYRSTQCNPGTIIIGSTTYAIPAGGVTPATANLLIPGTINKCELYRTGDILAKQKRDSIYFNVDQELGDRFKVFLRGHASYRKYIAQDFGQGSTTQVVRLSVPATNAFFVRPPGTTGAVSVDYFYGPDEPQFDFRGHSDFYQFIWGGQVKLPFEWQGNYKSSWSRTDENLLSANFLAAAQTAALASSDKNVALNPFGPNDPAKISYIFTNLFNPFARNVLRTDSIDANGPLFDLPGGKVRLAVGADYTNNSVNPGNYRGAFSAPVYALTPNGRKIKSAFGELFVPIVGASNAVPGIQRFDIALAGRIDDYSDVGTTRNPKVGINYSPVNGLNFKGSYGTSYKAPPTGNLPVNRPGSALIIYSATDPLSPTGTSIGLNINAGNPNLQPESAKTYSFTIEILPPKVPGLSLSATWFSLKTMGSIQSVAAASALTNPLNAPFVTRNPTRAQIDAIVAAFPQLLVQSGTLTTLPAFVVDTRPQNTGGLELQGIDFVGSYNMATDFGDLTFGLNGTYNTKWSVKLTDQAAPTDLLNHINNLLKLRMRGTAGWSRGPWSVDVAANYTNGYTNDQVTPFQSVDANTTFDLRAAYTFKQGSWAVKDLTISLEAQNLFDKEPPFVDTQSGIDGSVASTLGRFMSITLDKRW